MFDNKLISAAVIISQSLRQNNLKITCAESCTGGLLSALFTNISGSSEIFDRGFVTYSNAAKVEMLDVKNETLKLFGAVSEEVALEMANGALKNSKADIAISVTGIAGPNGGDAKKPVGLVYIAIATNKKTEVVKFNFSGERDEVRRSTVISALKMLKSFS